MRGIQIPSGWKLVPIKLTEDMENAALREGYYEINDYGDSIFVDGSREEVWAAMLSAAPTPPSPKETDDGR